MKYYVISDPHGFYDEMIDALREAGFFDESEPYRLVLCGDLLDRGGGARETVDFMLKLHGEGKLIYVHGNHEELMVQCLHEIARGGIHEIASGMSVHETNGTYDTLLQLAEMSYLEAYDTPEELVRRVMRSPYYRELLPTCVDYFETPNYVFVHGWIPCLCDGYPPFADYKYDPAWREADSVAWRRAKWVNGMELACLHGVTEPNKTVVCGHFHASYGHSVIDGVCTEWGADAVFTPFYADGVIALDACTARSGFVNCIVIED